MSHYNLITEEVIFIGDYNFHINSETNIPSYLRPCAFMFCFCLQVIFLDYSIYIYVYSITYYTWYFVSKYHLKTCQSLWILCQTEEHESAQGFEPRRARFHLTSAACLTTTLPVLACYGCIHSHTLLWHVQCNQFHFLKMNITAKLLNHEWIRKMKSVGWIFTFT